MTKDGVNLGIRLFLKCSSRLMNSRKRRRNRVKTSKSPIINGTTNYDPEVILGPGLSSNFLGIFFRKNPPPEFCSFPVLILLCEMGENPLGNAK